MELVHHFGWEAMKGVYRAYEELISNGLKREDDEEKEDRFYEVFSRQVLTSEAQGLWGKFSLGYFDYLILKGDFEGG